MRVTRALSGLGFSTFVDDTTGARFLGRNDAFMLSLEDHSTGKHYPQMTDAERATANKDTGDLYWTGTQVVTGSTFLTTGRHAVYEIPFVGGKLRLLARNASDGSWRR